MHGEPPSHRAFDIDFGEREVTFNIKFCQPGMQASPFHIAKFQARYVLTPPNREALRGGFKKPR